MNEPYQNFTSSSVTMREMGTKLVSIRIQEPKSWINNSNFDRFSYPFIPIRSHFILSSLLEAATVPVMAAITAKMN